MRVRNRTYSIALLIIVASFVQIGSLVTSGSTCKYYTNLNKVVCSDQNDGKTQGKCSLQQKGLRDGYQIGLCLRKVEDEQVLFTQMFEKRLFSFYDLRITYEILKSNRLLYGMFQSVRELTQSFKQNNFTNINILQNGVLVFKVTTTRSVTMISQKRVVDSSTNTVIRKINQLQNQVKSQDLKLDNKINLVSNKSQAQYQKCTSQLNSIKKENKILNENLQNAMILINKYRLQAIMPKFQRIWGINSNNDLMTIAYGETSWTKVSSEIKYVSVGYDGTVWAITLKYQVLYRKGVDGIWVKYPAYLMQLEVGKNGIFWGVNGINQIFHKTTQSVKQYGGSKKFISYSPHGTVLGTNINNNIYRLVEGGVWQLLDGTCMKVSIGLNDEAWCINPQNNVFMMLRNGAWIYVASPKCKYIKITHTGSVWAIGLDDKIYVKHRFDNSWLPFEGSLTQISVY